MIQSPDPKKTDDDSTPMMAPAAAQRAEIGHEGPTSKEKTPQQENTQLDEDKLEQDTAPKQPPTLKDFNIPENEMEYQGMLERFISIGMTQQEGEQQITTRKTKFNKACREFQRDSSKNQGPVKGRARFNRKNSQ